MYTSPILLLSEPEMSVESAGNCVIESKTN